MLQIQADERKQQGERNAGGDDQAGTEVVEKKDQHHDHQQYAAQQIAFHDLGGERNQVAAVVERMDFDVLGQDLVVEFLGLRFDSPQDVLSLLAGAQQDHAFHGIVLGSEPELAETRRDADLHPAHVLDQDRHAIVHREHHVADILQRGDAAQAAHIVELPALRIKAAAGVVVVCR